jgi:hypothetical protein
MSAEPPEVKFSDGFFIGRKGRIQRKVKKKPFHQTSYFIKNQKRGGTNEKAPYSLFLYFIYHMYFFACFFCHSETTLIVNMILSP